MTGHLPYEAHRARLEELRRSAERHNRARREPAGAAPASTHVDIALSIAIRRAGDADRLVLERLAALDETPLRLGEFLVAEVDGELQAAVHVDSGEAIADPFRPTSDLVALLGLRARRLRATTVLAGGPGLRARLRALTRAAG
jgi:hypothetical protein